MIPVLQMDPQLVDFLARHEAGETTSIRLPTLKRLAGEYLSASFAKTDGKNEVYAALRRGLDTAPADPASFRFVDAILRFNIHSSTRTSQISFQLKVHPDGRCFWNDAIKIIVEELNQTQLRGASHAMALVAPHQIILIEHRDGSFVCASDQGKFFFQVDDSVPEFSVGPVEVSGLTNAIPDRR